MNLTILYLSTIGIIFPGSAVSYCQYQIPKSRCLPEEHTRPCRNRPRLSRWATSKPHLLPTIDSTKARSFIAVPTARSVAASVFLKQKGNDEFILGQLDADPGFRSLELRDRSFARLLVTTVERRFGQIDKVLAVCTNSEAKKHKGAADKLVQACLRIGAAQLLFLEVAPHAAVKETVEVLRRNPLVHVPESKIKFVNAVLRRLSREGKQVLDSHTSAVDNVAPWLYRQWETSWGEERAKKICLDFMTESPVYLSVNSAGATSQDTRIERCEHVRQMLGNDSVLLDHGSIQVGDNVKGPISEWPLYNEGGWWVQDASAALPAIALFNAINTHPANGADVSKMHVVDLCAAPGGKTAQLLSLGFGKVTAVEMSARRSKRLNENLVRLGLASKCSIVLQDGTVWQPNRNDAKVSGVIVDVPCSATGTASRRPDVLRRNEDLGNLLETQHRLAVNAVNEILGVGGVMVYSTCSLLTQESEDQVKRLLQMENGSVLETVPFTEGEIPGFDEAIDENGWMRVLPGSLAFKCDGFFVARLRKVQ